jgi:hypothetical protein
MTLLLLECPHVETYQRLSFDDRFNRQVWCLQTAGDEMADANERTTHHALVAPVDCEGWSWRSWSVGIGWHETNFGDHGFILHGVVSAAD